MPKDWLSAARLRSHPNGRLPRIWLRAAIVRSIILFGFFTAATSSTNVQADDTIDRLWEYSLGSAQGCQAALNESTKSAALCFLGDGINHLLDRSIDFANSQGKETFGEHFQITSKLSWASAAGSIGISGDLDVVAPLSFAAGNNASYTTSAFFVQQGVTRWRDQSGTIRNDLRHGVSHRFRLPGDPDSGIVGVSAFYLHSVEYEHEVLAFGLDYAGGWGTGAFRYFAPTTGWHHVRPGFEERALEGLEIGVHLDLTPTLDLNTTGYRWQAEDGLGWTMGSRVELGWQPHPWLKVVAGYDKAHNRDATVAYRVGVSIPLGGPSSRARPRWEGLGLHSGASGTPPTESDLWRPVEQVGQIRVAERKTSQEEEATDEQAYPQFEPISWQMET